MAKNKKIKVSGNKPKVQIANISNNCSAIASVSFKYLTTNSRYNFDFYAKNRSECIKVKAALYDKIEEICKTPWLNWYNSGKGKGLETLDCELLKFKPNNYDFYKDQKVIVFRFYHQKCRLIGMKLSSCSVFDVIGFDFDYSAYNHG